MLEYNLDIAKKSVWAVASQNPLAHSFPFYLTEAGHFFSGDNFYTKRSGRDGYYLLYTASGSGKLRTISQSLILSAGYAILVRCDPLHHYATVPGQIWENYWIHLDGTGLSPYYEWMKETPVQIRDPKLFETTCAVLPTLAPIGEFHPIAETSQNISSLLTEMLLSFSESSRTSGTAQRKDIFAAAEYIQKNYQYPISIDDIIKEVNISKFHFVRLFQKQMGTTPYQYLVQYRLHKAMQLLSTTDMPVLQVANMVGYTSESNFIHQFGRYTKMTPLEYRNHYQSYIPLHLK